MESKEPKLNKNYWKHGTAFHGPCNGPKCIAKVKHRLYDGNFDPYLAALKSLCDKHYLTYKKDKIKKKIKSSK